MSRKAYKADGWRTTHYQDPNDMEIVLVIDPEDKKEKLCLFIEDTELFEDVAKVCEVQNVKWWKRIDNE